MAMPALAASRHNELLNVVSGLPYGSLRGHISIFGDRCLRSASDLSSHSFFNALGVDLLLPRYRFHTI